MRKILPLLVLLCGILAPLARADDGWPRAFDHTSPPAVVPDLRFADEGGLQGRMENYRGRLVILNFWATWCGPCVREMPALDRLQARLGNSGISVVPISMDRGGPVAVRKFFTNTGIGHLPVLTEADHTVARYMKPIGLPLTLIVGRDGLELARVYGAVDWDAPEMLSFVQNLAVGR